MKVGTFGGIGVYIHWSFWLLILVYLLSVTSSAGLAAGLYAVVFVLSIFACIVLHEFGHAAAAAVFGIPTADITLLPIGGMARLTRLPEKPSQELLIALAGPAVNVVIAGILFLLIAAGLATGMAAPGIEAGGDFLVQLLFANVVLIVFNMLPAFPMDGGRVLRSLLAMRFGQLRATEIAARIGRWMALAFGLLGLIYMHFGLILVAIFIFIAGTAELWGVRARAWASQSYAPGGRSQFYTWSTHGPQSGWRRSEPDEGEHRREASVIDAVEVRRLPDDHGT